MKDIVEYFKANKLQLVLLLALITRLLAAIFAKGFAMLDDHFLVIEPAFKILENPQYWSNYYTEPQGHSIVYPALHYYFFQVLDALGIVNPQSQMFLLRLIHGIYSIITVYLGYKIAEKLGGKNIAFITGLILALLWPMPLMSVKNLIEMVCIPPMMAGIYYCLREKRVDWLLSGIMFALAFTFRYQSAIFGAGIGMVLLFRKDFINAIILLLAFLLGAFIFQGIPDWIAWGYPFAGPIKYYTYNSTSASLYTVGPWYQYILLLIGILIPPLSLFLFFGFFRTWKRPVIFIPTLIFIIFHSIYLNKQERFILPVLPIFIILAVWGWLEYRDKSKFHAINKWIRKINWTFFWIINTILLLLFTFTYSKKTRIEPLSYLNQNADASALLIETGKLSSFTMPMYYHGRTIPYYMIDKHKNYDAVKDSLDSNRFPDYAILYGRENLQARLDTLSQYYNINLQIEKKIPQSFLDEILYRLNPEHNKSSDAFIYKIQRRTN